MEELNKEYVSLITQMRELNSKRFQVFLEFKKLKPDVEITMMHTPSIYRDLYGNDSSVGFFGIPDEKINN